MWCNFVHLPQRSKRPGGKNFIKRWWCFFREGQQARTSRRSPGCQMPNGLSLQCFYFLSLRASLLHTFCHTTFQRRPGIGSFKIVEPAHVQCSTHLAKISPEGNDTKSCTSWLQCIASQLLPFGFCLLRFDVAQALKQLFLVVVVLFVAFCYVVLFCFLLSSRRPMHDEGWWKKAYKKLRKTHFSCEKQYYSNR